MYKTSNSKIEDRAIGALNNIIDEHPTMEHQFKTMDKEMSWDGYIWIYKDIYGKQEKKNYDDKVPVQIKGHVDEKKRYINKKSITYRVALNDLKIYFSDRGVLYFQIFMSNDGKKREVFYVSLFPTKIKYYLEKAKNKGNKNDINIAFTKLEKKSEVLYSVVKQFSNESKKQGFGYEQIVQNAIKEADMNKVKEITASAIGATNEYEILKSLGTGDVSLYAKLEGNPMQLPLEWHEDRVYYMVKMVNTPIYVAGKKYYNNYKISANSNEAMVISPSENLNIDIKKFKFNFNPKTDIITLKNDAEFLLSVTLNEKIRVGNHDLSYKNMKISKKFKEELMFYVELGQLLEQIEFDYCIPFKEIPSLIMKKFIEILAIKKRKKDYLFTEKAHWYNLNIDGKFIPLIVFKNDLDGDNELFNAVYSTKYQMSVTDKRGVHYRVPMFSNIEETVMKSLYKYDVTALEQQISNTEFNLATEESLNLAGLNLIHAYDGNKEKNLELLNVAENLYYKMISVYGKKTYYVINLMQIKKRLKILEDKDIEELSKMKCTKYDEEFGRYAVIGNKEKAEDFFIKIGEQEQDNIKKYPIYTLYMEN